MAEADLALQKLPPQNLEAEQAVLGAVLLDNTVLPQAIEVLRADDFHRPGHRRIYEAMLELFQKNDNIDLITTREILERNNQLDEAGGTAYLASLMDLVPSAANIKFHCKIVREKAVLRSLIKVASRIASMSYEGSQDVESLLDEAESKIFEISERRSSAGFDPINEILKGTFEVIEKLYDKQERITGVATGFTEFDNLTSGLQPSDLVVIAGRPSMGKTSFVLNVAEHVGIEGRVPVAIFSLEMAKEQLAMRLLSSRARVDGNSLRRGFLSQERDFPRLALAAGNFSESAIFIDDSASISVLEIRARARRLKAEHDIGLVIIDYLQLIKGRDRIESRQQEISEISRSLKALAKELNVPVIALSQLSRAVETRGGDRRPLLSDLRESGAIEQDADVVAFIYREEVYRTDEDEGNSDVAGKAEVIIRKQRNGPIGTVSLTFLKEYTRFENQEARYSQGA